MGCCACGEGCCPLDCSQQQYTCGEWFSPSPPTNSSSSPLSYFSSSEYFFSLFSSLGSGGLVGGGGEPEEEGETWCSLDGGGAGWFASYDNYLNYETDEPSEGYFWLLAVVGCCSKKNALFFLILKSTPPTTIIIGIPCSGTSAGWHSSHITKGCCQPAWLLYVAALVAGTIFLFLSGFIGVYGGLLGREALKSTKFKV